MTQLKNKCDELIKRYEEFISKDNSNLSVKEKIDYINSQFNAISMISKIISISSTGDNPDDIIVTAKKEESKNTEAAVDEASADKKMPEKKKKPPKEIEEKVKEAEEALNEIDGKSAKDIIAEELDLWRIGKTTIGYRALISMPDIDLTPEMEYGDVLKALAINIKKSASSINTALIYMANNAVFSKSKYIPKFKKLDNLNRRNEITKEDIVKEFKDYCIADKM